MTMEPRDCMLNNLSNDNHLQTFLSVFFRNNSRAVLYCTSRKLSLCVARIPPRDNDGVEVGLYMYANVNLLYAFANNWDVDQHSFPRILICVMRFVRLQNDNFLS